MAWENRPHIGTQNIHQVAGIRFLHMEREGTAWLQAEYLDEEGVKGTHTAVFYGCGLTEEKVKAAMREYLGET